MIRKYGLFVAIGVMLVALGLDQSVYIVDQTQNAIVLQLGKPVGGVSGPGLHFKLPFVQQVVFFEHRILEYDASPAEVITKDKKNLVVDNYARWRIVDPLLFYRTARTLSGGISRLEDIVYADLRVVLGRYNLIDIVSSEREKIMQQVVASAKKELSKYGVEVVDVRIKRADLPPENQKAIFARMRSERERQAKQYRSEGHEEGAKIRALADRERTIMLAEAKRQAQELMGQGDAKATKIYGQAYGQDIAFYNFWRSLEAYQRGLTKDTRLIFTPEDKFLKILR